MTDAPPVIDTAFLAAAAAADLEDWGPLAEATEEGTPMSTRGLTIWSAPDSSGAEAGIWECTALPLVLGAGADQGHLHPVRFADRHPRRRPAGHLGPGDVGFPARLARPLGTPRDRAQGLRALLSPWKSLLTVRSRCTWPSMTPTAAPAVALPAHRFASPLYDPTGARV